LERRQAARRPGVGTRGAGQRGGRARADAGRRHRSRGEASRSLQGLAPDRRRHQGGARGGGGGGGVIRRPPGYSRAGRRRQRPRRALEDDMKIMIAWLSAIMALVASPVLAESGAPAVAQFEVDAFWPKPLPNKWILGQVSGIATDRYDRIWVVHRLAHATRACGRAEPTRSQMLRRRAAGAGIRPI